MCEYCENGKELLSIDIICASCIMSGGTAEADTYIVFVDRGYLRLADKDDCGCLDHGEKKRISFCPMCGGKLEAGGPNE